jgi:signal transduction histidine kinase
MLEYRRPSPPAPETTILVVLVLTLVLSGVLAYHAQRAAVSHRQAAEAALRDYAAFASWELERRLAERLPGTLQTAVNRARLPIEVSPLTGRTAIRVFQDPGESPPGRSDIPPLFAPTGDIDGLDLFTGVLLRDLERCGCEEAVRDIFLLDLAGEDVQLRPADLHPTFRDFLTGVLLPEALEDSRNVLYAAEMRLRTWEDGSRVVERVVGPLAAPLVVRPHNEPTSRVVYTYLRNHRGEARAIYGFVLDVPQLATPIIRSIVETTAFLPPSLTGDAANDDVLALRVSIADGEILYRSADHLPAATQVTDTLHTELASLVIEVAIRPELAQTLLIGGLPRSRLPLVLVLFAIALGLLGVAAVQLRRQRVLARLRSGFVSGVSHELRTPLAQIQLFAELLATDRLRPDQRERSVRIIGEESRRLAYLVQNILQFASAERRATRIAPEPTEAAPLIEDIVDSFAPLARSREVTLTTDLAENIRAPLDRGAIRQVLLNLLDNAVKYGPHGQTVAVGMRAHHGSLTISVSDGGPGVPPAERERIWQPYHRLQRDVESASGGSGIGLSVVKELVELHGGRVSVGEGAAGGAVFEVWLPGAAKVAARPGPGPERYDHIARTSP